MPHDSRSRGKWVWKGKFSYFNSYSKSIPQMEMPPIFFTPLLMEVLLTFPNQIVTMSAFHEGKKFYLMPVQQKPKVAMCLNITKA